MDPARLHPVEVIHFHSLNHIPTDKLIKVAFCNLLRGQACLLFHKSLHHPQPDQLHPLYQVVLWEDAEIQITSFKAISMPPIATIASGNPPHFFKILNDMVSRSLGHTPLCSSPLKAFIQKRVHASLSGRGWSWWTRTGISK